MCQRAATRRDFLQRLALGSTMGASILDLAFRRAAWAQTMVAGAPTDLFEIQKVADGAYFAFARPQAVGNCNAAVFVNSADVLVVDAHSKPSAAAGLIAQIRQQITPSRCATWWIRISTGITLKEMPLTGMHSATI